MGSEGTELLKPLVVGHLGKQAFTGVVQSWAQQCGGNALCLLIDGLFSALGRCFHLLSWYLGR